LLTFLPRVSLLSLGCDWSLGTAGKGDYNNRNEDNARIPFSPYCSQDVIVAETARASIDRSEAGFGHTSIAAAAGKALDEMLGFVVVALQDVCPRGMSIMALSVRLFRGHKGPAAGR
jgi:hypothetical protein